MEDKLLQGIIPFSLSDRDEVLKCKQNLLKMMGKRVIFKDETNNIIYKTVVAYFNIAKGFMDLDQFKDILIDNQLPPETLSKALMQYDILTTEQIAQEKFEFYLSRFVESRNKSEFEDTLLKALSLLRGSDKIEEGKTSLSMAKESIIPQLFNDSIIDEDIPRGDITTEKDELYTEYESAKKTGGVVDGIITGIDLIDEAIDAMQKGQLIVGAAGSGEGKSFMAVNIAWHACVRQKKNVVVITAETLREQYRRRIMSRHSNLPKFGYPIEITDIKNGSLSEEEEEVYNMVIEDFTSGEYGSLEISQVANGTTIGDVRIFLETLSLTRRIDLVILDYLSLFKPDRSRGSAREETVDLFKAAKNLAVTFNKGEGVPVLTLHQISTQARDKVKFVPGKFYTLGSLADTSEAAKSADAAFALLRTEEMEEENELGCGILKTRDSCATTKLFKLYENYACGLIANLEEG